MAKRCGVIIIGGSGYGAGELLRLLAFHPDIEACSLVSRSHAGAPAASVHTHLAGVSALQFESAADLGRLGSYERGAVVLAMPSGNAVPTYEDLVHNGLPAAAVVIDLSGDLRLADKATHERYYPEVPFSAEVRAQFSYAFPELSAARGCRLSNPGCLATAAILALAPVRCGFLKRRIVIDAKTGTSGAGREPQASMHHPSRANDFTAYKTLEHRHEPEIVQALGAEFARDHAVAFVPHLIPVPRGIFVTAYAELQDGVDAAAVSRAFADFYAAKPMVRLRSAPPRLVDVVGTNFCDIFFSVRGADLVVMSAIDNLGKGMAGQAIQNLNRCFGLPDERGLLVPSLGPV